MYRVQLQEFQGPLDLLLFFIQRDELDIYDIPIAQITDEYLAYVRVLQEVDLDVAGDFIYMAALLIQMKARTLLPSSEVTDDGEPMDPRRELVERLLEYVRYKQAAQELVYHYERRADQYTRGMASMQQAAFAHEEEVLVNTTIFDLVSALRRVLTEAPEAPVHAVQRIEYSIEAQQHFVLAQLHEHARLSFVGLARKRPKAFIIATFLAVLELARQGRVQITFSPSSDDFYVVLQPDSNGMTLNGKNGRHE